MFGHHTKIENLRSLLHRTKSLHSRNGILVEFVYCMVDFGLLPRNLTWNLKMMVSKRNPLFQVLLFRFHVKFQGCISSFHLYLALTLLFSTSPPGSTCTRGLTVPGSTEKAPIASYKIVSSFLRGGSLQSFYTKVTWGPYKWPKIHGELRLFHPTYRSFFTPFIFGDGAHLVYIYICTPSDIVDSMLCDLRSRELTYTVTKALLKIIFLVPRWDMLVYVSFLY